MATEVRAGGLVLTEHELEVPLDHARPDGETITVFVREARAAGLVAALRSFRWEPRER